MNIEFQREHIVMAYDMLIFLTNSDNTTYELNASNIIHTSFINFHLLLKLFVENKRWKIKKIQR